MEELKTIWNKLNELQIQVGELIDEKAIDHSMAQLKQQETSRIKEANVLKGMIFGTVGVLAAMLLMVVFVTEQSIIWTQVLGLALIGLGMYWMLYQFQRTQIPFEAGNYDQEAQGFIKTAHEKLILRKKLLTIAPLVYGLLLLSGLHLMLHPYLMEIPYYLGIMGATYGICLGILGGGMGIKHNQFEREFRPIMERFERFLAE